MEEQETQGLVSYSRRGQFTLLIQKSRQLIQSFFVLSLFFYQTGEVVVRLGLFMTSIEFAQAINQLALLYLLTEKLYQEAEKRKLVDGFGEFDDDCGGACKI